MTRRICPYCKSSKIAEIVYGHVVFNKHEKRKFDEGKIVLGGCCVMEDQPYLHCCDCKNEW